MLQAPSGGLMFYDPWWNRQVKPVVTEVEKFAITLPPELSIALKTEPLFWRHLPSGAGHFIFG